MKNGADMRHDCAHYILAICGLVLSLGSMTASSQQVLQPADLVAATEAEEIRKYSVEFIIFEYTQKSSDSTEVFPPDELPPAPGFESDNEGSVPTYSDMDMAPVVNTGEDELDASLQGDANEESFVAFTPEEMILEEIPGTHQFGLTIMDPRDYTLNNVYEKLLALDAYNPLMRGGWTQQTLPQEQSRAIKLRRLGNPPLRLDGDITLYLGRYLHLAVNLSLHEPDSGWRGTPQTRVPYYGDRSADADYAPGAYEEAARGPIFYRLEEDRIVRSGELRYFDHPRFGVIAKVMRIEQEKREPGQMGRDTGGTGEIGQ